MLRRERLAVGLVLGFAPMICGTRFVQAQNLEIVASFNGDAGNPSAGLAERADGSIYGATANGGVYGRGSIFVLRRGAEITVETVHSFSWADGGQPFGGLNDGGDGYLYGSTPISLGNGGGTVYRLDSSGRLTTVHDFGVANSSIPSAPIGPRNGFLYGTTFAGGANGVAGTVYRLDASGQLTTLHEFDGPQGARPAAGLLEGSDGYFYGATQLGGAADQGTIFRIDSAGNFTLLHSLTGDEGEGPQVALIEGLDGLLYGTASLGGSHGEGTVFKVDKSGHFTKLHDLDSLSGDGGGPLSSLVQAPGGAIYGTTAGAVFHVEADGTWSVLHTFSGPDGSYPLGRLLLASDGLLYGTTYFGPSLGSVFRVDTSGNFETLWTFENLGPRGPRARLRLASDGKFWGTTEAGGAPGDGTIFTLEAGGILTSIHEFDPIAEALPPYFSLTEIAPGILAGTTWGGGRILAGHRVHDDPGRRIRHSPCLQRSRWRESQRESHHRVREHLRRDRDRWRRRTGNGVPDRCSGHGVAPAQLCRSGRRGSGHTDPGRRREPLWLGRGRRIGLRSSLSDPAALRSFFSVAPLRRFRRVCPRGSDRPGRRREPLQRNHRRRRHGIGHGVPFGSEWDRHDSALVQRNRRVPAKGRVGSGFRRQLLWNDGIGRDLPARNDLSRDAGRRLHVGLELLALRHLSTLGRLDRGVGREPLRSLSSRPLRHGRSLSARARADGTVGSRHPAFVRSGDGRRERTRPRHALLDGPRGHDGRHSRACFSGAGCPDGRRDRSSALTGHAERRHADESRCSRSDPVDGVAGRFSRRLRSRCLPRFRRGDLPRGGSPPAATPVYYGRTTSSHGNRWRSSF